MIILWLRTNWYNAQKLSASLTVSSLPITNTRALMLFTVITDVPFRVKDALYLCVYLSPSAKWVPKCLNADQKRQRCQSSEQLSRLPRFFGIKTASSSLIIFQRVKLSTWIITYLCWCNWRTFWRKNAAGRSPKGSCSCTTMPRFTGHLQPGRNWPTRAFSVLITHPILRIWPRRTTPCSLDWKKIERLPFFIRRGGHCCCGDLVGRTTFWFFFWWLAEVRATG